MCTYGEDFGIHGGARYPLILEYPCNQIGWCCHQHPCRAIMVQSKDQRGVAQSGPGYASLYANRHGIVAFEETELNAWTGIAT